MVGGSRYVCPLTAGNSRRVVAALRGNGSGFTAKDIVLKEMEAFCPRKGINAINDSSRAPGPSNFDQVKHVSKLNKVLTIAGYEMPSLIRLPVNVGIPGQ